MYGRDLNTIVSCPSDPVYPTGAFPPHCHTPTDRSDPITKPDWYQ